MPIPTRAFARSGTEREGDRVRGEPLLMAELSRQESLRLLGQTPIGRIVYTVRALPAIVPVNHVVDDGVIVVRTHVGGECAGSVVAYQADHLDPEDGWVVTVTGVARRVLDPEEIAGYAKLLTPLVAADDVVTIRILPEIVTGYRLVRSPAV